MKDCKGFKRYSGLVGVEYTEVPYTPQKLDIETQKDIIMDKIFAKDINGWPNNSLSVMLSEKTPADIRQFIEDNILVLDGDKHVIHDESVVAEFQKMSGEFIAKTSRDRFESLEEYEARLQSYINDDNEKASFEKRKAELQATYDKLTKSADKLNL